MATLTKPPVEEAAVVRDPNIVPVYVWQSPVRLFHWIMVLSLTLLTITGFYMHHPYIVATSPRAWVMGTMRFVHEIFGFVLLAVLLMRIYWFFAGNEWARWRAWVPLKKGQWASIRSMLLYYSYQRSEPEPEIGHNSLATSTYMVIVFLLLLECLTGLVLFSVVSGSHFLRLTVGWIPHIVDIQYIRLCHYFIMFLFMAFVIHHVYSAVLVSMEQKNGLMESIFSGWKFVHRSLLEEKQRSAATDQSQARR